MKVLSPSCRGTQENSPHVAPPQLSQSPCGTSAVAGEAWRCVGVSWRRADFAKRCIIDEWHGFHSEAVGSVTGANSFWGFQMWLSLSVELGPDRLLSEPEGLFYSKLFWTLFPLLRGFVLRDIRNLSLVLQAMIHLVIDFPDTYFPDKLSQ